MSKPASSTARRRPDLIRVGDRVRVIIPQVCIRVGYPKAVKDYLEKAEDRYGKMLAEDMENGYAYGKALQAIAYGMAKQDGFGGKERTLHLKEVLGLKDQEFTVGHVRTVMTGTYYPPNSWRGWTDYGYDYDYEPGGLANMKGRRLVTGFVEWGKPFEEPDSEIPVEHLEKIK